MPSWVRSTLTIKGENPSKVIEKITKVEKNEITNEENLVLDFNKIIPMPETLHVCSGSLADHCIDIYLNTLSEDEKLRLQKLFYDCSLTSLYPDKYGYKSKEETDKLLKKILEEYKEPSFFEEKTFKTEKEVLDYGKQIVENLEKYGSKDWYDWSVKNWGTKWNACSSEIKDNTIYFETAWDDVRQVIFELSNQYPDYSFEYRYAYECTGEHCGECEFKDGEILFDKEYDDFSKEAYELAFELWDDEHDYYKFNEDKNTYEYIGNEEAEKIYQSKRKQIEQD